MAWILQLWARLTEEPTDRLDRRLVELEAVLVLPPDLCRRERASVLRLTERAEFKSES
jgi:hypothetical protein